MNNESGSQIHKLGLSDDETKHYKENKIEFNKKISQILKNSKAAAKKENCYICNEPVSSFCNSHSIPQFSLKNITSNGKLFYSGQLIDDPYLNRDKGLNEAGTFNIICRSCDAEVFKHYENPDNYNTAPTDKMLSQIAMKNYLKAISKRELEIQLYASIDFPLMDQTNSLDLKEYVNEFKYAKKACESKWNDHYFLSYYQTLDYVVPIAFQSQLALISDFNNQTINNVYNHSPEYSLQNIHLCIFPLENQSVIIMFVKKGENRYRQFLKQFHKLSLEEQLKALNYIVFNYSEDVFLYKELDQNILNNPFLRESAKQSTIVKSDSPIFDALDTAKNSFDLSKRDLVPNLLDKKYSISRTTLK